MRQVIFCAPLAYQPRYEAISKEISMLLPEDGSGIVVSIPPFKTSPWITSSDPCVRIVHPLRLLFPLSARLALRGGNLLHVFTPLPLPRRISLLLRNSMLPSIVTVISHGGLGRLDFEILCRARCVVAECQRDLDRLRTDGLPASQVRLIPPACPIDGRQLPVPQMPLRILFASSPLQAAELEQRGVDLIVAAARRLPAVFFHLLWRPGVEQCLAALPDLPNLICDQSLHDDITEVLATVHAVVAPFRAGGKAKSVPLSVIEALQCGRPVLVSSVVGLANLVAENGWGEVFEPDADHLVEAIERLQRHYEDRQETTGQCVQMFRPREFYRAYTELVGELLAENPRAQRDNG